MTIPCVICNGTSFQRQSESRQFTSPTVTTITEKCLTCGELRFRFSDDSRVGLYRAEAEARRDWKNRQNDYTQTATAGPARVPDGEEVRHRVPACHARRARPLPRRPKRLHYRARRHVRVLRPRRPPMPRPRPTRPRRSRIRRAHVGLHRRRDQRPPRGRREGGDSIVKPPSTPCNDCRTKWEAAQKLPGFPKKFDVNLHMACARELGVFDVMARHEAQHILE